MGYELSRPVVVEELPNHGRKIDLQPTVEEMATIASRLDLVTLDKLEGIVKIRPEIGREIVAEGEIITSFVQNCVVTGESIIQTMTFQLERRYSEDASEFNIKDEDDDIIVLPMDDGPDPIEDGIIDVGEAVVEELALLIPPYPRVPGAEFNDIIEDADGGDDKPNPFAKLAALKKDLESKS